LIVALRGQESPNAVGEIWNWSQELKSCVLTKNPNKTLDQLCFFKDDFIVGSAGHGDVLVVWKYDALSLQKMEEKRF
jgi:hypothetical protein